jgi:hypothetical protein
MIAQLTAGNKVKFQYVERNRDFSVYPVSTAYAVETYEGTVIEVRDTETQRLNRKTVRSKPEVERSRFLLTVQLPDNKIKSFYDGRIINVKKVNPTFLQKVIDKFKGK